MSASIDESQAKKRQQAFRTRVTLTAKKIRNLISDSAPVDEIATYYEKVKEYMKAFTQLVN